MAQPKSSSSSKTVFLLIEDEEEGQDEDEQKNSKCPRTSTFFIDTTAQGPDPGLARNPKGQKSEVRKFPLDCVMAYHRRTDL